MIKITKLNVFLSLILLSLFFVGCEKDEQNNNSELIRGTWVNTLVNGQPILTNAAYTMEFKADNTELYAVGIQVDENNKSWQENSSYTFSVNDNLISIDGTDTQGSSYHMEFDILSIDQETLKYSVQVFLINGTILSDTNIYTCEKVIDDFSTEFTGVWYGHSTNEGNADSLYHYWEYFADGTYNYYYLDENNNWIKKSDNEGNYFLYGNLLVSNYTNDLLSGGTGLAFECWNFTLDENNMTWTGLRENNSTVSYEMEKVPAPPETEIVQ